MFQSFEKCQKKYIPLLRILKMIQICQLFTGTFHNCIRTVMFLQKKIQQRTVVNTTLGLDLSSQVP